MNIPINPHPEIKGRLLPRPEVIEAQLLDTEAEVRRLRARVAELEQALAEIGCRTNHGNHPVKIVIPGCGGLSTCGDIASMTTTKTNREQKLESFLKRLLPRRELDGLREIRNEIKSILDSQ